MSYIQLSEANCRNCLRCVRVCPTKAMTYQNHQPTILEDECILCGKCYAICPHSAKKVHSDGDQVRAWIAQGQPLALSIAPSFASVWPDYPRLKRQLKTIGFQVVEETAVGARLVSQAYMKLIEEHRMKNILSTCCPAVVTYVEKNFPELIDQLAPVVSPMIAHGYDLKERYPGVKTVFLTPCIAKQKEAADPRFAGAVDAVLTMPDLSAWLKEAPADEPEEHAEEIRWETMETSTVRMYPTPGGVIRTLSSSDEVYERVSAEGMDRVKDALKSIAQGHMEGYFFELSACEQSCLGGPLLCHVDHSEWRARSAIRRNMDPQDQVRQAELPANLRAAWQADPVERTTHTEEEIKDMLFLMGKTSKEKELDCGACGYESCRAKAIAVLEGKADPKLCLPYALEHAQSISNLIIENTPNGILVLDEHNCVREINPAALNMMNLQEIDPIGMPVESILPDQGLHELLQDFVGVQYYRCEYPQYHKILNHAMISIEDHRYVILILMDLTVEETKEKVIRQMQMKTAEVAQTVIDDQMRVVQEIASLLGETTAKSKVALTRLMKAMDEDD